MKTVFKKSYVFIAGIALFAMSCVESSTAYKKIKAENDALRLENVKFEEEVNGMLGTLEEVESNFESIRQAENYILVQQQAGMELNSTKRERFKQNMQLITNTLKKNKEQIADLQSQLDKSSIKSASLQKTISRLSSELNQKAIMIASLQEELSRKNIRIDELDGMLASMNEDLEDLATTSATQKEKLDTQDQLLHTAYYCFGTSKELKLQKILSGGGLFSKSKVLQPGFNKDYFLEIDIRKVKEIPLFTGKATLKSSHPQGSYEFVEDDENGDLTFLILDENAFWSLSKYLVIEVK